MVAEKIKSVLLQHFPHEATSGQIELIEQLSHFVAGSQAYPLFIVKGYAGTGKTSVISALVRGLPEMHINTVLLAPTGRAAKVLAAYSQKAAFTIHKKIYQPRSSESGPSFSLRQNMHKNTLFIVDEASMISNEQGLSSSGFNNRNSLLDDLFQYVFNGMGCRLIFVGDSAQLPPVGLNISPALDIKYLKRNYAFDIESFELTEVVRQAEASGILANATNLRTQLQSDELQKFQLEGFKDIVRLNGMELQDALTDAYNQYGAENTMVVCRSNKRANIFNQQIRTRIQWLEDELAAGDFIMVVKNNYFWLPKDSEAGFIANGDIAELTKIGRIEEIYGFRFANVQIRLLDYPNEPELEVKILLDTIHAESPSLPYSEQQKLYQAVKEDYQEITNKRQLFLKLKEDPYLNALQVKFAYAITCHKAQGGQWQAVFVDQGYLTKDMINYEYKRWLYTALSRASEQLYLVNFNDDFFESELE